MHDAAGAECWHALFELASDQVQHLSILWDQKLLRPMVEQSAEKYAKDKNITPRDCGKES